VPVSSALKDKTPNIPCYNVARLKILLNYDSASEQGPFTYCSLVHRKKKKTWLFITFHGGTLSPEQIKKKNLQKNKKNKKQKKTRKKTDRS